MKSLVTGFIFVSIGLATTVQIVRRGGRALSETEQQAYLSMQQAIRSALPAHTARLDTQRSNG